MDHALTMMDSFYPDPQALRKRVLASEFGTHVGPEGATYTNVSLHQEPELPLLVEAAMGHRIIPKLMAWRMDLAEELPHSAVHSDEICASHASVLYLNPPEQCRGGTAFWQHKTLGWDATPRGAVKEMVLQLVNDWANLDAWEMTGFVGMKFNRFITYPTSRIHSRWPQEGFGTGKEDGRLIWICFYDVDPRYRV